MSTGEFNFLTSVSYEFQKHFPNFDWNDFFLSEERPKRDEFLLNQFKGGAAPSTALQKLLLAFGRL